MLASLSSLMSDIALGPERRKVKQYLDTATRDTVYADLARILSWQLKRPQFFQETFDKYCIEDPSSHEKYWTAESFHSHIRSSHSADAISDGAVALLWRIFHFYAYHPFPPDPQQHTNVDFGAFRRAALLTVSQCDDLLGTRELDWYWRESGVFFRKAGFARIFRSIAVPDRRFSAQQETEDAASSALSDAMDVLIMVGPQFIHAVPSETQLESVARRLFADGPAVPRRSLVRREDISTFMELLVRLRLRDEKWAKSYHFGAIVQARSANGDLTKGLVDGLTGTYSEQNITAKPFSEHIELMPNLSLRFQQLWAVLFQPPGADNMSKLSVDEARLTSIAGAISLFAPHIMVDNSGRQRPDEQDTRLKLDTAQVSLDSQDMTMPHLCQNVSDDSTAHIVLVTTAADDSSPTTVIGAYLPNRNPVEVTSPYLSIKLDASHILFQLQPSFRLLRYSKSQMPLADLISPEWEASSDAPIPEGDSNLPYRIGGALRVDPTKRIATLTNGLRGCYMEVPLGGKENTENTWEVTVPDAHIDIFALPSSRDSNT
ncbi:hypothetical protein GGS24DRAFT_431822 [Hypoxylon argillaceum]|nr:hypothetical protein GGS24DRAFT_431822 [Hypoxylon argillaceum]